MPVITDPQADEQEAFHEYGIKCIETSEIKNVDALIIAVAHSNFLELTKDDLNNF